MKKIIFLIAVVVAFCGCEPIFSGIDTISDFSVTAVEYYHNKATE